jgi:hypothetical protein
MKKIFKWVGIILGILIVIAFFAFLYFIPPFSMIPPEEFTRQTASAAPSLEGITDPAERAIAERGKYIAMVNDCSGCHTPLGDQGPKWDEYLAGGNSITFKGYGTFVTRNLTPDPESGLARRSDEQVKRVLRTGLLPEGRVAHYRDMPWASYSNWTPEDRYAVLLYLRHLKPVIHSIPEDNTDTATGDSSAIETFYTLEVGVKPASGASSKK